MINVQPFLDRLDELKEHMDFYIEMLYASQYFKDAHIIEERNGDWKIKYLTPNPPIQPLTLGDDGSIKAHLDLLKSLTDDFDKWVNDHIGIPESRMGKPCRPDTSNIYSDRAIAMLYSEMATKQIKQKR